MGIFRMESLNSKWNNKIVLFKYFSFSEFVNCDFVIRKVSTCMFKTSWVFFSSSRNYV